MQARVNKWTRGRTEMDIVGGGGERETPAPDFLLTTSGWCYSPRCDPIAKRKNYGYVRYYEDLFAGWFRKNTCLNRISLPFNVGVVPDTSRGRQEWLRIKPNEHEAITGTQVR